MSSTIPVTNIQRFSIHDGPGIRTTVFLKGCPLRCAWCHNPETQKQRLEILYTSNNCIGCGACLTPCAAAAHSFGALRNCSAVSLQSLVRLRRTAKPVGKKATRETFVSLTAPNDAAELLSRAENQHIFDVHRCNGCMLCVNVCPTGAITAAGKVMSVQEILDTVLRDKAFYGAEGGITLSGGEPLLHTKACLELLRLAKENGIATTVQTSGFFDMDEREMEKLADLTDVFLWDFKDGNAERHKKYTGQSNDKIMRNLLKLDKMPQTKCIILRCIMVNTVNMDVDNFSVIAKIFKQLKKCTTIELVPYHALGGGKYKQLGYNDNGRQEWIPSPEDMEAAKNTLWGLGCAVKHIES